MNNNNLLATNFDLYKKFYYVAQFKSFTEAANYLEISQPSVTKTIKKLETDFGTQLFKRSKTGIELTQTGELLWNQIEPAFKMIFAAEEKVRSFQKYGGGSLSISSNEVGFLMYVMPALRTFQHDYPQVNANFQATSTKRIYELLDLDLVDFAVVFTPIDEKENYDFLLLDSYEEAMICGSKYKFLSEEEHSLQDIMQYPFVSLTEDFSINDFMTEGIRKQGMDFKPKVQVTSYSLLLQAVIDNFGIGTVHNLTCEAYEKTGEVFRVKNKELCLERQVYVVRKKTKELDTIPELFIKEYLLKHISS